VPLFIGIFSLLLFIFQPDVLNNIPYKNEEIIFDGIVDEWEDLPGFSFEDTLSSFKTIPEIDLYKTYPHGFAFNQLKKPISRNKVIVKAFWNLKYLNLAFLVFDEHLFAQAESTPDKPRLHLNDGIEIYIDSKDDDGLKMNTNDYQFIVDLKNRTQVFRGDRRYILSDTVAVPKDYDQNILFKSNVKYTGSVNNPSDRDSLYLVEVSIPFAAIGIELHEGISMRMDLCCNDIDYSMDKGIIVEYASTIMWSFDLNGYSDFGYPKYWNRIRLTGGPGFLERLTEKYKDYWIWIYLFTIGFTIITISFLLIKVRRAQRIPLQSEMENSKIVFITIEDKEKNQLSHNQALLRKAVMFISNNKNKPINSESVAEAIGISLRQFQRLTREELNSTPTNFIYIVKLKLAEEFLTKRQGNITEAAYEFGFTDLSHFSRLFKNHFGISPSDYLKRNPGRQ
jgi:AraC-like DNA-binding protein